MTQIATLANITTPAVSRIQFTARRATVAGIQFTTTDEQVTTVNGLHSTCTCGMERYSVVCSHRIAALSQERIYAEQAKARAAYCTEFSIY